MESAILSNITILPAIPDFALMVVLYFSLRNGKTAGESLGFVSGFIIDFLSFAPLGLNSLVRTIVGYMGGWGNSALNVGGFFLPFFIGGISTIVKAILFFAIAFFFPQLVLTYKILSFEFFSEVLLNAFLCPFVFKFLGLFDKILVIEKRV